MADIKIDLGGEAIGRAATRLIETVASGLGAIWAPHQMRRIAKAELDVRRMRADAELEFADIERKLLSAKGTGEVIDAELLSVDDGTDAELLLVDDGTEPIPLVTRTERRLRHQEHKRQINVESVVGEAAHILNDVADEDVPNEPIDPDWTARFFQSVQDVSNEDLRSLWAKVLAAEIVRPKTTKYRTLDVLRGITASEAALFQRVASVAASSGNIFCLDSRPLDFADVLQLIDAGLVAANTSIETNITIEDDGTVIVYPGYLILVAATSSNRRLRSRVYMLSQAGLELRDAVIPEADVTYIHAHAATVRRGKYTATVHRATAVNHDGSVVFEDEPLPEPASS